MGLLNIFTIAVASVIINQCLGSNLRDLLQVEADGKLFAVLVAGSDGWYNYRHQVSFCFLFI